ncbi:MAG: hypothetical protein DIU79_05385 [Actinobacteria bacterium]|nr:MAG: hypothetical protein DIU79_05385 [Actinomycetota bacterium]
MNRLLSRLGLRACAVALLLVGGAGGYYLGEQQVEDATAASLTADPGAEARAAAIEQELVVFLERRMAEEQAARRAAEVAKAEAQRAQRAARAANKKRVTPSPSATTTPFTGPIPESCQEYSGNRAIGCALLVEAGFALDQMPCLDRLWTKESGWNHRASNPSTGAYGIPQALPGSKMASVGADWQTNPATQIKWGLGYIKGRYGTPCAAWSFMQREGWY